MTVELRPGVCTVSLRHPPKVLLNRGQRIPPLERGSAVHMHCLSQGGSQVWRQTLETLFSLSCASCALRGASCAGASCAPLTPGPRPTAARPIHSWARTLHKEPSAHDTQVGAHAAQRIKCARYTGGRARCAKNQARTIHRWARALRKESSARDTQVGAHDKNQLRTIHRLARTMHE